MVPGFGQQPRFIVTIQPAGTLFNPPAQITIPNGDALKPGEITEMYGFDHDLAMFVSIGTGTASADGTVIKSDPGVGVVKAGWFCGGPPTPSGGAGTCPDCQMCNGTECVADASQNGNQCSTPSVSPGICKDGQCVCPVPVNFHQVSGSDQGNGTLHFEYSWDSSTGDLDDLANCQVGEEVTYPGGSPFVWPSPPWGATWQNPTVIWLAAKNGGFVDNHLIPLPFVKPLKSATVPSTQNYRYQCGCANDGNPVVLVGPITITRSVTKNKNGTFKYTVTKSGISASVNPIP